tara:strand:+ start:57 stop:590 length:534 start_codon:yes stop_codon:yes gene_type:complete
MNIKDLLIVKDNFFDKNIYEKIIFDISKLKFSNRNTLVEEKDKNIYQKIYFSVLLNPNHFAVKEVVRKLKEDYLLDLLGHEHSYFLSTKHEKSTPHEDIVDVNCLIYLKGEKILNSGTAFYDYEKENNQYTINRHIGFKENRAIIFDSKILHSSLQFNTDARPRYVMANFFYHRNKK